MDKLDYNELALEVVEIIDEAGQDITVTRRNQGSYDLNTGRNTVTETTQTVTGAIFDSYTDTGTPSAFKNDINSLVKVGDRRVIMAALATDGAPVVIEEDDFITPTIEGREYSIVALGVINPAGIPVAYDIIVRG